VSGVGALTGTIYQANEATRIYELEWPSGGFSFVLQDERTLVSKGGLQNFILREHFAITTRSVQGQRAQRDEVLGLATRS
jgi:hypothetical protein